MGYKLHLGCGCELLDGYSNIDIVGEFPTEGPSVKFEKMDVFEVDRHYPANSVDEILTKYMMEHIPYQHISKLLYKFHCILRPGGILDILVPDLSIIVKHFINGQAWKDPGGLEQFNIAVWGVTEWETSHQSIWTPEIGQMYLEREGFFLVKEIKANLGINGGEGLRFLAVNQYDEEE